MKVMFNKLSRFILLRIARFLPDELFLKLLFPLRTGYKLNLDNPITFNEKLQWLKLHDRRPEYINMVDKAEVKKYVSNLIGDKYLIPTIAVYDSVDEIDWDMLPNQFVVKCTHDSGGIFICKDKSTFDINRVKKQLRKAIKVCYFYKNREWPYKSVKPRIIIEQYMEDESNYELKDYKFFCFNGVVKYLFVATDRYTIGEEVKFDFYDEEFKHLPLINGHPNSKNVINVPEGFEEMKRVASILSQGIPHVRVDLYNVNGKIYFGEMTFYHFSGMTSFVPIEWDYTFGENIVLPNIED